MYKVFLLITSLEYGGAQTELVNLATQLKGSGWQVEVCTLLKPEVHMQRLAQAEIPLHDLAMQRGLANPIAIFRLVELIRRSQPQILHSHMVHANLLARLTRLFVKVPLLISTAQNMKEGSRWREIAYRLSDPLCDLTTNVSQVAVDRYVEVGAVPAHKVRYLPNSVNVERFNAQPEARQKLRTELSLEGMFVWIAVGRLTRQKNYPNLLHAFAAVAQNNPNACLLIAGGGELEAQIMELIESLGLGDRVRLLGNCSDMPDLFNAADAMVMASDWEGMPLVLLEAAASGLPIVATDVGGNGEVVIDGENGWLVPPGDTEALAVAMQKNMQLPDAARSQMGAIGRQHVLENFSLPAVAKRWQALYQELYARLA
ncbi:glycosyl transferase group 1 [Thalassoporum mexicanum PCC 7367]|uniref:glycosyltransferase n=1 Tax=Thalassoporum mexicanum TaxID=3457544 RepID=UPI00029FE8FF|nr:glycosyltransferase [Pseudanabaena sp. PCC 7367]AFY69750.1 glycosyl transferase group 1 [Pseudanabaena sp. PCC 7367]